MAMLSDEGVNSIVSISISVHQLRISDWMADSVYGPAVFLRSITVSRHIDIIYPVNWYRMEMEI